LIFSFIDSVLLISVTGFEELCFGFSNTHPSTFTFIAFGFSSKTSFAFRIVSFDAPFNILFFSSYISLLNFLMSSSFISGEVVVLVVVLPSVFSVIFVG